MVLPTPDLPSTPPPSLASNSPSTIHPPLTVIPVEPSSTPIPCSSFDLSLLSDSNFHTPSSTLPTAPHQPSAPNSTEPTIRIPDPSDFDPLLLEQINQTTQPYQPRSILKRRQTSLKSLRRFSHVGPSSLDITQLPTSPPKPLILSRSKSPILSGPPSDIDSTTFSLLYPKLSPESKNSSSSADNLLTTHERRPFIPRTNPRHSYNLRSSRTPEQYTDPSL